MRIADGPNRRSYPAALLLGISLALAFPEPSISPLAFVSIAGMLWLTTNAGARHGSLIGFIFGFGFFGVLIYWISIIGIVAYIVLVSLQALFLAAFGAAWGWASVHAHHAVLRVLAPASLWVAVEYIRSIFPLRGFTWGQLAQSQNEVGHLLRVAGIGGSWLVAALIVAVASLLFMAIESLVAGERGRSGGALAVGGALIAAPWLVPGNAAAGDSIRVAIVQGNVPRAVEPSFEKQLTILRSHVHLTEELPSDVDLVVWPESAVGIDPEREGFVGNEISGAARAAGAPMIVGANLDLPDDKYRVVALHVDEDGRFVDRYQKTHLVPFGEYVPARRFLDWIPALDQVPRDAVPASEEVVFDLPSGKVAPVISFEGDFGSLVRGRVAAGGRLLIVATNTSTWEESWASAQHVAMSQVRAAENGVYVVHAALSGISAIVEPDGSVVDRTPLWTATALIGEVRFATDVTLYARVGDVVAYASFIGSVLVLAIRFRHRRTGTVG